jgi:hypothetical protein
MEAKQPRVLWDGAAVNDPTRKWSVHHNIPTTRGRSAYVNVADKTRSAVAKADDDRTTRPPRKYPFSPLAPPLKQAFNNTAGSSGAIPPLWAASKAVTIPKSLSIRYNGSSSRRSNVSY